MGEQRRIAPMLEPFEAQSLASAFASGLVLDSGLEPNLGAVLDDALAHPGSLVRAHLAYAVARRHGVAPAPARDLAVAIEYFHTASLIFDDLPAMDDGEERRGRPCPHRRWGEAAATLGALGLINRAYALLWRVLGLLEGTRGRRAAALVEGCLGANGILDGQARDLYFAPGSGEDEVLAVAEGKTVTLIRLTLLLPAMVAGVGEGALDRLAELARAWGLSYQVVDDFKDGLMSRAETGKTTRRDTRLGRPNLPAVIGSAAALERLEGLLEEARGTLRELCRPDPRWKPLEAVQQLLDVEHRRVVEKLRRTA